MWALFWTSIRFHFCPPAYVCEINIVWVLNEILLSLDRLRQPFVRLISQVVCVVASAARVSPIDPFTLIYGPCCCTCITVSVSLSFTQYLWWLVPLPMHYIALCVSIANCIHAHHNCLEIDLPICSSLDQRKEIRRETIQKSRLVPPPNSRVE